MSIDWAEFDRGLDEWMEEQQDRYDESELAKGARCIGCNKPPGELYEYQLLAESEGYDSADDACRSEEGTYNPDNGHFRCNACYIKAGMPLGITP